MKLGGNWGGDAHHDGIAAVALPSLHHPVSYNNDAHLTLVYAGDDHDAADITGMRRTVQQLARVGAPFVAEIVGTEMFGENSDEPVLLLEHPQFKAMRRQLEQHDVSNWPYFRPHVAVPTLDGVQRMPREIAFDRLGMWVGSDDRQNFWLGNGNPTRV
jgi:2'-5' RNA ligase